MGKPPSHRMPAGNTATQSQTGRATAEPGLTASEVTRSGSQNWETRGSESNASTGVVGGAMSERITGSHTAKTRMDAPVRFSSNASRAEAPRSQVGQVG